MQLILFCILFIYLFIFLCVYLYLPSVNKLLANVVSTNIREWFTEHTVIISFYIFSIFLFFPLGIWKKKEEDRKSILKCQMCLEKKKDGFAMLSCSTSRQRKKANFPTTGRQRHLWCQKRAWGHNEHILPPLHPKTFCICFKTRGKK